MNLIILYGPPGVGKLTVATELAKLTGYKLFHNHLTINLVKELFDRDTPLFKKLVRKIRLILFEAAAKQKINGLIFTYVYYNHIDQDKKVNDYIRVVKDNQGKVFFVKLTCEITENRRRISNPERSKLQKIQSVEVFDRMLAEKNLSASMPFKPNLIIDTTNTSPSVVAAKIKKHYRL